MQRNVDPDQVLIVATAAAVQEPDHPLRDLLDGKSAIDDQITLYVCRGFECQEPIAGASGIETFASTLR